MRAFGKQMRVTSARRGDVPDLASLAAASTWDSPDTVWLVPDPEHRPAVLHAWYAILIEQALRHGHADMTIDRRAAAIWLDRTRPLPAPAHYLRRLTATCGRHAAAVLRYERLLDRHRPRTAHLHLAVLATTDPSSAAVLLAYRHQDLDRAGIPAHATAATAAHRGVLTAAGYQPEPPFRLLPGGPEIWPLQRPPAARTVGAHLTRT
jgi:hypothetical protein